MGYDLEKYRSKREKVLGKKKRGPGFGSLVIITAMFFLGVSGYLYIPGALKSFQARNLDDVVYKLEDSKKWPERFVAELGSVKGVSGVLVDKHGTRLVLTFDRTRLSAQTLENKLLEGGLKPVLLSHMDHNGRMSILKEEEEFEAI